MTIVFDSFTWIEYFAGTQKGQRVKSILETTEACFTPCTCLTEIKNRYTRAGLDSTEKITFIQKHSAIIQITDEIAIAAADYIKEHKLPAMDAIIYACSRSVKGTLLTGDKHFENVPEVSFL